jgi:hypothetical protein
MTSIGLTGLNQSGAVNASDHARSMRVLRLDPQIQPQLFPHFRHW